MKVLYIDEQVTQDLIKVFHAALKLGGMEIIDAVQNIRVAIKNRDEESHLEVMS